VNADYFRGAAREPWHWKLLGDGPNFHQSSHLGDEFLLRELSSLNRLNVRYEGLDLKLSYDLLDRALRFYAGGGYLFDRDPSSLTPWST